MIVLLYYIYFNTNIINKNNRNIKLKLDENDKIIKLKLDENDKIIKLKFDELFNRIDKLCK